MSEQAHAERVVQKLLQRVSELTRENAVLAASLDETREESGELKVRLMELQEQLDDLAGEDDDDYATEASEETEEDLEGVGA